MKVLILGSKKTKSINRLVQAFKEKGFSQVDFLEISKLNLVSRGGKTQVVNKGIHIEDYDGVYVRAKLNLAPFVEPLLDHLRDEQIFTQFKPGAFYLNSNEALQIAALNGRGLPVAKTVMVVDPSYIKDAAERFRYPLIFKSYIGQQKTQSILVESPRSLRSLSKSIKLDLDCVIVKEFIEADLIQCAVIGEKVFAIKRRWNGSEIDKLAKGVSYRVSDSEKVIALRAALACNCEIATVKLSRGVVTEVIPDINFPVFNDKTSEDLFGAVAVHFENRISGKKLKAKKLTPSLLDKALRFLEGTFND